MMGARVRVAAMTGPRPVATSRPRPLPPTAINHV